MSIFSRAPKAAPVAVAERPSSEECQHWDLGPRWDNADDLGKRDKVTFYVCGSCGITMTPAEAEAARQPK